MYFKHMRIRPNAWLTITQNYTSSTHTHIHGHIHIRTYTNINIDATVA